MTNHSKKFSFRLEKFNKQYLDGIQLIDFYQKSVIFSKVYPLDSTYFEFCC